MSTQITVNSTALHLIEVEKDTTKSTVLSALFKAEDIAGALLKSTITGLANKMDVAYKYAKESYSLGLPEGKVTQINTPTKLEIATAIKDATTHPFDILVYKFISTDYKPYYEVLDFLTNSRAYDFTTNTIGAFPGLSFSNGQQMYISGSSVSVNGFDIIVSYEYWGPVAFWGSVEGVTAIQYEFSKISTHSETINRPSAINTTYGDGCLIASYKKLNLDGSEQPTLYNWIYRTNSDLYPELDHQRSSVHVSEYLPVVPIRHNDEDYTAASRKETDLYKTSDFLLSILNISFTDLGTKVNANPSIADIDQAYVMFGADLQSNEPATLTYLNHYFDLLGTLNTTIYSASASANATLHGRHLYENNTFTEHGLSLSMSFSSIVTSYIPGSIDDGKIDNARKTIEYTTYPDTYEYNVEGFTTVTSGYTTTTLTLDLQVTAVTLRRVVVKDLVVINHIDGNYVVTTTLDRVKDDPANHNMIIPLEYNITTWLKPAARTALYADCTLLVINAIDRRELEWYEESWFTVVIMVVTIIIIAYTGQAWLVGLAGAIAEGTTAVLLYLAVTVVMTVGMNLAMDWIVSKIGDKIGAIGALVLAVIAIALTPGNGTFNVGFGPMTYAQAVLQVSMAMISSVNEFIKIGAQEIVEKYTDFTNGLKDAYAALDTNSEVKSLDYSADFEPLVFMKAKRYYSVPNESPAEFFNRTLNLPANTYYGIHSTVPDFVSNLLLLDKNTVSLA